MKEVLVSVIIPNYNHARYLDERICSVLNQTYQNFELIILDDCSTDNSRDVIEKYRSNPHVSNIVYNEENSGSTFKQWEKGINLSKGDYVWIAESDDSCKNTFLEKIMSMVCANENVSVAFAHTFTFDSKGYIIEGIYPKEEPYLWEGTDFIKQRMCLENTIVNASMAVFSRQKVLRIEKKFLSLPGAGDYMFWIEMAEMGNVVEIREPLSFYRIHLTKVTNRNERNGCNSRARKDIFNYMEKKGYVPTYIKSFMYAQNREYIKTLCTDITQKEKEELLSLWSMNELKAMWVLYIERLHVKLNKVFIVINYMGFYMKKYWYSKCRKISNNDLSNRLYAE